MQEGNNMNRQDKLIHKFKELHEHGAKVFGWNWLAMNTQLVNLVADEFPEIKTSDLLMKTLLSRIAYWTAEKVLEKYTPPKIEIVEKNIEIVEK